MSDLKGIAFQSDETQLAKLRELLRKMADEELIKFGKTVRSDSFLQAVSGLHDWAQEVKRRTQ